jgi:regulator of replication initiation timing
MPSRWTLVVATLLAVTLPLPAAHAQSSADLAADLARLRGEVEELSEQLTNQKTETRNELQALARQKSDLQIELDREKLRLDKLRAAVAKKREQVDATSQQGEELRPIYESAMVAMRTYVEQSLPFRRRERLSELDKVDEQRKSGVLSYPRALGRLWGFVEDEFRMTRENAMFQQTIELDGEEQLAEVVRVGMVMLFFQTSDGEVGYTQRTGDGWRFVASDAAGKPLIRTLFDSFKKQIRVGLFRVPNALPTTGQ